MVRRVVAAVVVAALCRPVGGAEEEATSAYLVRLCPEAVESEHGVAALETMRLEEAPRELRHTEHHGVSRHVHARFDGSNRGYYVGGLTEAEAGELASQPGICHVEKDAPVRKAATYNWAVDRISQRKGLEGSYKQPLDLDGRGVTIYVLDTGLDTTHCEFERGVEGGDYADRAVENLFSFWDGGVLRPNNDVDGHGTHVAGLAAGVSVGVASGAGVYGIKLLDDKGDSTMGRVVEAFQYVRERHASSGGPSVIVASFEGNSECGDFCAVNAMYLAARDAAEAGIVVTIAAGNEDSSACDYSPSAAGIEAGVIVVGAMGTYKFFGTYFDRRFEDSNRGACVDVFAPGVDIKSAQASAQSSAQGECDYDRLSGTSQATPLVAGVAAQHLQVAPRRTPRQVEALILAGAQKGLIAQVPSSSPNLLLQAADREATTPTLLPTQPRPMVSTRPTPGPTLSPTRKPTTPLPPMGTTPPPTTTPTRAPTKVAEDGDPCADSSSWAKAGKADKDCRWVAAFPAARCVVKGDAGWAFAHCRAACGTCDRECGADDPFWALKNTPDKTCTWVAEAAVSRCPKVGEDGAFAFQKCPAACHVCSLATCADDPAWRMEGDATSSDRDCTWVGEYKSNRCVRRGADGTYAFERCRRSCFACADAIRGSCADDAAWHKTGDPTKDCSWVGAFAPTRCTVKGQDGQWAFEECPVACASC